MKSKGKTALSARLTALCMAVLMAFSLLPSTASAAEGTSFGKITGEAEFTTGSYVMVTDTGYAPQKFDNNWLPADELGTALGDTIPAPADETVWEIAVSGGFFLSPGGTESPGNKLTLCFPDKRDFPLVIGGNWEEFSGGRAKNPGVLSVYYDRKELKLDLRGDLTYLKLESPGRRIVIITPDLDWDNIDNVLFIRQLMEEAK